MEEIRYKPFKFSEDGEFDTENYWKYFWGKNSYLPQVKFVIDIYAEKMKNSSRDEWKFGDIKITKRMQRKVSVKWKEVYEKLKTFLEIRADDSRAKEMEGLKFFKGIGYCIAIDNVLAEIGKRKEEYTTESEDQRIVWPSQKDEIYSISIPEQVIERPAITEENIRIVLACRSFKSGIEKEVIEPYKKANKIWFKIQTGWDEENLPPADESPVIRVRLIGRNDIIIRLIREDCPKYKDIIEKFCNQLETGEYKIKIENGIRYVNIKTITEGLDKLYKQSITSECRYEIIP